MAAAGSCLVCLSSIKRADAVSSVHTKVCVCVCQLSFLYHRYGAVLSVTVSSIYNVSNNGQEMERDNSPSSHQNCSLHKKATGPVLSVVLTIQCLSFLKNMYASVENR